MKTVLSLSGGQDSTTCLFAALNDGNDVHCLNLNYGQLSRAAELDAALHVIALARTHYPLRQIYFEQIECEGLLIGRSPLVDHTNTLERYSSAEEMARILGQRRELTFIAMRNTFFLTLAFNRADVIEAETVMFGAAGDDADNYPDCTSEFVHRIGRAFNESLGRWNTGREISIRAPVIGMSKADEARYALTLPGCYEALSWSMTAYDAREDCEGTDHASVLRAKGFAEAAIPDPRAVRLFFANKAPLPKGPHYEWVPQCKSLREVRERIGAR